MRKLYLVCLNCIIIFFIVSTAGEYGSEIIGIKSCQKVLLTGFEPFDVFHINPSELIVENLDGQIIADKEIIGFVLPVDFDKSLENITDLIELYEPDFVVSLGLDASAELIEVEKCGINLKRGEGDILPCRLDRSGPFFRFSDFNEREIVKELKDEGIKAKQSFFAGLYVCNAVLYGTLDYIDDKNLDIKSGFIHVPLLDTQDPSGMSIDELISATKIIINTF
jgi:pyroglutamyl-peptidase